MQLGKNCETADFPFLSRPREASCVAYVSSPLLFRSRHFSARISEAACVEASALHSRRVLQLSTSFPRGASSSSTCLFFPLLVLPFAIFSPRFLCSATDHAPRGGIAMKSENIGERSDAHIAHATAAVSSQLQLAQCSLKVPIGNGNSRSPGCECERTSETHSVTRIVYSGNRSALIIDRCIMFTEAIIAACTTPARDARRVTFAK